MNVAVIGSGLIGQAWSIVFARAGCAVNLWDGTAQAAVRAVDLIGQQARLLQKQQLLGDAEALVARIRICDDLAQALQSVDYVQENLPEKLDIKKDIFCQMDELADPAAVLASSSSSIPASTFTEHLSGRHRCLVAHPVNPPYLVPVVELCGAPWTDETSLSMARQVLSDVGQKPVMVHREMDGFVLNRLQGALLREAFRLVDQGVISVEDLDTTVKDGLGLRWSFMGPFETIDLNAPGGVADYCSRYGGMYADMARDQTDCSQWSQATIANVERQRRAVLPEADLINRRIWRDTRLMALRCHKKSAETTD